MSGNSHSQGHKAPQARKAIDDFLGGAEPAPSTSRPSLQSRLSLRDLDRLAIEDPEEYDKIVKSAEKSLSNDAASRIQRVVRQRSAGSGKAMSQDRGSSRASPVEDWQRIPSSKLSFSIRPQFFVTCLFNKSQISTWVVNFYNVLTKKLQEDNRVPQCYKNPKVDMVALFDQHSTDREKVQNKIRNAATVERNEVLESVKSRNEENLFDFPIANKYGEGFFHFDHIGVLVITLLEQTLLQTGPVFFVSEAITKTLKELQSHKSHEAAVLPDLINPPFLSSFATHTDCAALNNNEIMWTDDVIEHFKESVARWSEFYSGQFLDYRSSLFEERIQNNLSNRLSEFQFIRRNSSFVYMPRVYADGTPFQKFMPYMMNFFVLSTQKVRALRFALNTLVLEIIQTSERLDRKSKYLRPTSTEWRDELEAELDYLRTTEELVSSLFESVYREVLKMQRQHGRAVFDFCLEKVFDIRKEQDAVQERIYRLKKRLDEARAVQEQWANEAQTFLAIILNGFFGIEVLFTITENGTKDLHIEGNDSEDNLRTTVWVLICVGFVFVCVKGFLFIRNWRRLESDRIADSRRDAEKNARVLSAIGDRRISRKMTADKLIAGEVDEDVGIELYVMKRGFMSQAEFEASFEKLTTGPYDANLKK